MATATEMIKVAAPTSVLSAAAAVAVLVTPWSARSSQTSGSREPVEGLSVGDGDGNKVRGETTRADSGSQEPNAAAVGIAPDWRKPFGRQPLARRHRATPPLLLHHDHQCPPSVSVTTPVQHQPLDRWPLYALLGHPDVAGVGRYRPLLVPTPLSQLPIRTRVRLTGQGYNQLLPIAPLGQV